MLWYLTKIAVFRRSKVLKRGKYFIFCFRLLSQKRILQSFHPRYFRNCERPHLSLPLIFLIQNFITKVKFIVSFADRQIVTLSKDDGIYSTTEFLLDDPRFKKYACASSGGSLAMSLLPKVEVVKTRISHSVNRDTYPQSYAGDRLSNVNTIN